MDFLDGNEDSMEFDISDEFDDDIEEGGNSENDKKISPDEIDAMLEESLGDYAKPNGSSDNLKHEERQKVILKVRGRDHFEVLPEGWIEVTHNSGMPIYLHKQTRVCSVSKPYFLGPGSARKHDIPVTAIPCLYYLKQLEKEREAAFEEKEEMNCQNYNEVVRKENEYTNETYMNATNPNEVPVWENWLHNDKVQMFDKQSEKLGSKNETVPINETSCPAKAANLFFPSAKLESVKDMKETCSLDYLAVREYCQKRFEFQTITVKRFKTWNDRNKHQKQLKRKQRPFLPDSAQLITFTLPAANDKSKLAGNAFKKEFIINPIGKTPVCILHEVVQHTMRVQPKYNFKERDSTSTPYSAVVIIDDVEYGTGYGSSKKVAKSEAAKNALEVFIPKIKSFAPDKHSDEDNFKGIEFFDQVRIEDPRVCDLSVKAGQPYPYHVLVECLKRSYGMGNAEISIEMKTLKHQKIECVMKVGNHSATVYCKNKRDGKHRASQAILKQLYPHIKSWGSLLRMHEKARKDHVKH